MSRSLTAGTGRRPRTGTDGQPGGGRSTAGPGRPASRRRRRLALLALALAVALGGFAAWALYGSDWLRVERVRVSGLRVLTEQQVRRAAAVPVGTPMAALDKDAVARRLRERLPRVRTVEVVRAWPHEVVLKVVERRPELQQRSGGRYLEVDVDGRRYAVVDEPVEGVPLLEMDAARSPSLRHFGVARLRREAAGLVAALPDSLADRLRTVRVRSFDAITLELADGRTVTWGSAERTRTKAKALLALLKAEKDAVHFDVSVPSAPAAVRS